MTRTAHSSGRVIVIGSGPAGAAAAVVLAEAGVDTLVLEAGSEHAPLGVTARLLGFTFAKHKRPLREKPDFVRVGSADTRLYEELSPGGLSNHWACAVPRFSDADFADAERAGEEYRWPIGYADLAPWYDRVEPWLRIAADAKSTLHVPRARARDQWALAPEWASVEREASAFEREVLAMPYANGRTHMLTRSATAFNAYTQLLLPARRSGRLSMVFDAQVEQLEYAAGERRVVAVVYRDARTGHRERIPCRAVVVAAGAVNSARILLASTSNTYPHGLGNEHDVLGRYLHDHPLGKLVFDLPKRVSIYPASYFTRPSLARTPPLYAAACMQWCGSPALVRSVLDGHPGKATQVGFSVFGTMAPSRDDYVALDCATTRGPAQLRVRLEHPPEAARALEQARDDLTAILQRAGWEPRLVDWSIAPPGDSVHYGGTCRMHASPRYGVVDAMSRVHGVPNVAVADSGVFTTGPEKNPVLTAMALAARAADQLGRQVLQGDL